MRRVQSLGNRARSFPALHREETALNLPQLRILAPEQECTIQVQIEETTTSLSQMNTGVAVTVGLFANWIVDAFIGELDRR